MIIKLLNSNSTLQERIDMIDKLDEIFQYVQLVVVGLQGNRFQPIKSIKHFLENSPTYKSKLEDVDVWYDPYYQSLYFYERSTMKRFMLHMATKEYLEDFPFIYEGYLPEKNEYIIPIKFK